MNKFSKITEKDKKDWTEIKLKVPKNTIAIIMNYIYQDKTGAMNLGNTQYDTNDIEKMKVGSNNE